MRSVSETSSYTQKTDTLDSLISLLMTCLSRNIFRTGDFKEKDSLYIGDLKKRSDVYIDGFDWKSKQFSETSTASEKSKRQFSSKTNRQFFIENQQRALYSLLKDGLPQTTGQKVVAFGYPITIFILSVIVCTWMVLRGRESFFHWKVFWPYLAIATFSGWMWGLFILKKDDQFPGWLFYPWTTVGVEFLGMTIEDWLFYPICATFIYQVYRWLRKDQCRSPVMLKLGVVIIHVLLIEFFLYFGALCGKTLALQQAIFGLVFVSYIWTSWRVKHFIKFELFTCLFSGVWDYASVSLLAKIPGWSWCSHWSYVSFDSAGKPYHSSIFLSYADHPWAWVFNNPIEISPWLGITSTLFIYFLIASLDKLLYKETG
ncbi:MAG: hypothetical protein JW795_05855 [Chitinivibrionales bacterium]|nr:hypothetical protein [Chitinivibrionales bacterium]